MSSGEQEYVAVDEPRRAVGTALAVRADDALDRLGDVGEWLVYELVPAAPNGAEQLVRDWRHWQAARDRHAEIDAEKALAARQGMTPARLQSARDKADALAWWRMRLSWAVLAATALGLTVCSVLGHWAWEPWRWGGPALLVGQLAVGRYYRQRWALRTAWVWLPVFVALDITGWRWWPWWIAGGLLVAACVARGLLMPTVAAAPTEAGPHQPGDKPNWRLVWNTIERYFEDQGKVIKRGPSTRPLSANGAETGVAFTLRSTASIGPDDVRALERELGYPVNGSAWVSDPNAAGSGELRLCWEDPLPPRAHPRREPMSLSYTRAFPIAFRTGGRVTELSLNRTRVLLAGNSGSGKSEALQVILDAVCDMPDVTWSAIDLQDGPTFPPYERQWNCTGVYTELEPAVKHLRELRAWCKARNRQLKAGMDYDEDGLVDAWWIVSDEPGRRGHVLFADELSTATVDKGFASELTLLLEVIRKASGSAVLATPDLDKDRVPRAVIDQTNVQMGFACPFSDSQQLFGKGSTQSGWEPYELTPSSGDVDNDAGKAFIRGGGLNLPEVHRFGRMDKHERRERNKLRRLWREQFALTGMGEEAETYAVEVPEPLMTLERALNGAERITSDSAAAVAGVSPQQLAALLRPHGVAPEKWRSGPATERGYTREALVRAMEALT